MTPVQRGNELYDADRWDEAGVAFAEALREHPGDARAWYRLGNVRSRQLLHGEALECFRRALALAPADAQTLNNFGAACERLGRRREALEAYRSAHAADPALFEPCLNLGRLCESEGDLAAAAVYLRAGLAHHPGHPMLVHLLAAATGAQSAQAPREHLTSYFDGFAAEFDAHLRSLEYRVPQQLAELVRPDLAPGARVVDLGCGTGQVGAALAGAGALLQGVDISPRMLEVARARGVYAELLLEDAAEALQATAPATVDLVAAADVFIYIGELGPVFQGASRALRAGAMFAFSIEDLAQGDYRLLSNGRYTHSRDYVARLAATHGFTEGCVRSAPIRRQGSGFAQGALVVLRKR